MSYTNSLLDSLFLPGYKENETKFEKRCWNEFWSKRQDILNSLTYLGPCNRFDRELEMIEEFQEFRKKWETYAEKNELNFELVADNNVYDGGFINELIYDHLNQNEDTDTNTFPIPYNTSGKYKPFWETRSEQRGLLIAVAPKFKEDWGYVFK